MPGRRPGPRYGATKKVTGADSARPVSTPLLSDTGPSATVGGDGGGIHARGRLGPAAAAPGPTGPGRGRRGDPAEGSAAEPATVTVFTASPRRR
jgi:hypothetical protein